mmetsp:Transcript_3625/g.14237  ORF Transcript_3625/g.14237 Transcript_3625/m.14237 type:complete len:264 (+) Transcript_3625:785-1576(+)
MTSKLRSESRQQCVKRPFRATAKACLIANRHEDDGQEHQQREGDVDEVGKPFDDAVENAEQHAKPLLSLHGVVDAHDEALEGQNHRDFLQGAINAIVQNTAQSAHEGCLRLVGFHIRGNRRIVSVVVHHSSHACVVQHGAMEDGRHLVGATLPFQLSAPRQARQEHDPLPFAPAVARVEATKDDVWPRKILALRDDESPNLAVDRPKVDAGEARVLSLEEVKGAIVPGFAGQLGQLDPPTVFFIDGILNVMGIPVRNLLVHKT